MYSVLQPAYIQADWKYIKENTCIWIPLPVLIWPTWPLLRSADILLRFIGVKQLAWPSSFTKLHNQLLSSMAYRKTAVTPVLTHWNYCSFVLSHRSMGSAKRRVINAKARSFNTSRPCNTYECHWFRLPWIEKNTYRLFDTMSVPKPMLTYCQLETYEYCFLTVLVKNKTNFPHERKNLETSSAKWRLFSAGLKLVGYILKIFNDSKLTLYSRLDYQYWYHIISFYLRVNAKYSDGTWKRGFGAQCQVTGRIQI